MREGKGMRERKSGGLESFEMRHLYVWGLQGQVCSQGLAALENSK